MGVNVVAAIVAAGVGEKAVAVTEEATVAAEWGAAVGAGARGEGGRAAVGKEAAGRAAAVLEEARVVGERAEEAGTGRVGEKARAKVGEKAGMGEKAGAKVEPGGLGCIANSSIRT